MKYYKVVSHDLRSLIAKNFKPIDGVNFDIQYKLNEWVRHDSLLVPLMVFDSADIAINFLRFHSTKGKIFECSIVKSENQNFLLCEITDLTFNKRDCKYYFDMVFKNEYLPPRNSVFCSAVKLDKLIYRTPNEDRS